MSIKRYFVHYIVCYKTNLFDFFHIHQGKFYFLCLISYLLEYVYFFNFEFLQMPKSENYRCFQCYFMFSHAFILGLLVFVVPNLFINLSIKDIRIESVQW